MHPNRFKTLGLGLALVSGVTLSATAFDPNGNPVPDPTGTATPPATTGTTPPPATTGTTPPPATTPPPDPTPAPAADPFAVVLSGPEGDYPLQDLHKVLIRQVAPVAGCLLRPESRFTIVKDDDPADADTFADLRGDLRLGQDVTATLTLNPPPAGAAGAVAQAGSSTVINLSDITAIRVRRRGDRDNDDADADADDGDDAVPQERIEITFRTLAFGPADGKKPKESKF